MTLRVLTDAAVREMIGKLLQQGPVMAPHRREGRNQWQFMPVRDPARVELKYITTILPPKKYAFPPREVLVRYRLGERLQAEPVVEAEPAVLFGVHPCDLYALQCLDISMADSYVDPNWVARRQQLRVVGVDCEPDEWCFCAYMNTSTVSSGYDLFLTPIKGWAECVAEVATPAGEEMVSLVESRPAGGEDLAAVRAHQAEKIRRQQGRRANAELQELPLRFTAFADSPVWEKWAAKCYSCGTCNITCPTCFCFDVVDEFKLTLDEGWRARVWDGCLLEDFALVAPHENFRKDRSQRLRHRFYRKYAYLFTRYHRPYCCGCGRCVRQCLASIDPVEVLNDLLAEAAKKEAVAHGS
jgi:sulfhydrogenase subunit beta (sulfur reductase)